MNLLIKLWDYFNNKKTSIGAALFFLAALLTKIVSVYGITIEWIAPTIEIIEYIAMGLTTVGLGHKGMKVMKPSETNEMPKP